LINQDAYTETGSTASLSVAENEIESILGEVGFNISDTSTHKGHSFTPSLHASMQYEFGDREFTTTASFAAGGNAFQTTSREFDPLAWNFGGGLTLKTDTNLQLRARYNARMTEDLFENSGTLDLRFKF